MADKLDQTPCPACTQVGTLAITEKLVARPIGTWSLAGAQMKTSAVMSPVLSCSECDFTLVGRYVTEGNKRYATFA